MIRFTDDEISWLTEIESINSSVMAKAVPEKKLRELFDFKAQCAVSAQVIAELKAAQHPWALQEECDKLRQKEFLGRVRIKVLEQEIARLKSR